MFSVFLDLIGQEPMVYYIGKPIEKSTRNTSHIQNGPLICKQRIKNTKKLLSQPFLILKSVGFHILLQSTTICYCHSFKSYKVQSWKAVYISRRYQIAEKDNKCVNFWCRKSLGKLNNVPASNKMNSFSILDLFYVKIKFLNERNCSEKRYLTKLWYKIGHCRL